jgi:hypothetical protein
MTKRNYSTKLATVAGAGVLAAASATNGFCADANSPLLDLLLKKGIISEQDAKEIQAESQTNSAAASKWKVNDAFKNIQLFGDARFRYEYRGVDNPKAAGLTTGDTYRRERFRYALRFGIRGELYDNFNYGIRLETSTNPRSPWVTFADDSSPTPSGKSSDGINVGQVYLGWHPCDNYEMTVGRMPMPLYTTPMLWDTDINPEGAFEKFKFAYKNTDLWTGFGQFDYQNMNPAGQTPSSDTFILAWQLGANVKLPGDMSFKIAPVFYNYTAVGASGGLNHPYSGQGGVAGNNPNTVGANQNGINNLLVLEVPAEFNFKILHTPLGTLQGRLFGDFAYNFDGNARAQAAFLNSAAAAPPTHAYTDQNKAYQFGFGIGNAGPVYGPTQGLVYGSTSKKNTWEARVYWQHVEQYALDVNLMDSDFFEGRANLEGIYAAFAYSFTDAIIGTVRYGHADRINGALGTGGNNLDIPVINPIMNYNLVQLDLTWRF